MLLAGVWAPGGSGQGHQVVCGFLTSCRKDFTTGVQVAQENLCTKAGGSETKGTLKAEEAKGEEKPENGGLGDRVCVSPG